MVRSIFCCVIIIVVFFILGIKFSIVLCFLTFSNFFLVTVNIIAVLNLAQYYRVDALAKRIYQIVTHAHPTHPNQPAEDQEQGYRCKDTSFNNFIKNKFKFQKKYTPQQRNTAEF